LLKIYNYLVFDPQKFHVKHYFVGLVFTAWDGGKVNADPQDMALQRQILEAFYASDVMIRLGPTTKMQP
jgi:hypothetical protein